MLLYEKITWSLLIYFTIATLEYYLLISRQFQLRLGIRLWSENISDSYQTYFKALNESIVVKHSKLFFFPNYIIKKNNTVKIYSNPNKHFFKLPIVAFVNIAKSSPKIKFYFPIIGCIYRLFGITLLSILLLIFILQVFPIMPKIIDGDILINLTLVIMLILSSFYLIFHLRVNKKSIYKFIDDNINQTDK